MPPSVVWGIGVGLVIAAIDTLSLVLMSMDETSQWPIADVDFLANVMLYSLIGFRVGKVTGVVREAAEAGVIAGVLVAVIGIAVTFVLRPSTGVDRLCHRPSSGSWRRTSRSAGCSAILTGWLGTRAQQDRPASRRVQLSHGSGRSASRRGPRMTKPTTAANVAAISTPAAATSLAIRASGWTVGLARSTTASTAVLNASPTITRPIARTSTAISTAVAPTPRAVPTTATAAARWTRKFGWVRTRYESPAPA